MPEMNGFEATLHIRNKMAAPKCDIPIIALTADVTKADVDKCTEVGMNEYVSKPINETDLLNKISRLVKKHAAVEIKKYCNLDYLKSYSPNNPKFVGEIVKMFLEQTPKYVSQIKHAITKNDWVAVHGNSHKIRPSVDLIGMPKEIATLVKQVEDYAHSEINLDLIPSLFSKVEKAFKYAYEELELELKNTNDSKIK